MKRQERRHLKQNEFVATVMRVAAFARDNQKQLVAAGVAVVLIAAIAGGVFWWRGKTEEQAGALLGVAMTIYQAPISPAPTVPGASQAAGTYPTEQARGEAALAAFRQVASTYPSSLAGIQATYQEGDVLMTLGQSKRSGAGLSGRRGPRQRLLHAAGASRCGPGRARAGRHGSGDQDRGRSVRGARQRAADRRRADAVGAGLSQGRQEGAGEIYVSARRRRIPELTVHGGRPPAGHGDG